MVIKDIETIILDVPFHEVAQRNMARTLSGWHIVELCRVTTDTGLVGVGRSSPDFPVKVNRCSLHFIHSDDCFSGGQAGQIGIFPGTLRILGHLS